jgi:hypothetical protein
MDTTSTPPWPWGCWASAAVETAALAVAAAALAVVAIIIIIMRSVVFHICVGLRVVGRKELILLFLAWISGDRAETSTKRSQKRQLYLVWVRRRRGPNGG